MDQKLLTAGQFAKLGRTTKRTVLWYDKEGILKPKSVNSEGYRFYNPEQIIDLQVIMLLKKMRFSLDEIRSYLKRNNNLKELFKMQEDQVKKEVKSLQRALSDINKYYKNLDETKTLVKGEVKKAPPIKIYYIYKEGPYAAIKDYRWELKSYFKGIKRSTRYVTIFLERAYKPKRAKMKIGIVQAPDLKLKEGAIDLVQEETIPGYKALSYTHVGETAILSLLWDELIKYRDSHGFKPENSTPFWCLEYYTNTDLDPVSEDEFTTEINLPIR